MRVVIQFTSYCHYHEFLRSHLEAFNSRFLSTESLPDFHISGNLLAKAIKQGLGNKISPIPSVLYILGHCDTATRIPCRPLHPANNSPSSLPTKMPSRGPPIATPLAAENTIIDATFRRIEEVFVFFSFFFFFF